MGKDAWWNRACSHPHRSSGRSRSKRLNVLLLLLTLCALVCGVCVCLRQPVVQATPPHHQSSCREAVLRNQHAASPSGGDCDASLLQGSVAGRPGRQVNTSSRFRVHCRTLTTLRVAETFCDDLSYGTQGTDIGAVVPTCPMGSQPDA